MIPTENAEQAALFQWAEYAKCKYPELGLMYAIANGGKRDKITAVTLQRTGVKPGVPDVCLPVPRGQHGSLYVEMKVVNGGRVSKEQKEWIKNLTEAGNRAVVCKGWEAARDTIMDYLGGK